MKFIIVGVGKVGETLIKNIVKENHDIIIVDTNKVVVENIVNKYDVRGVCASGLERDVLKDAGVETADFFLSCTSHDEMNILCCALAKKLGAKQTIARVRDPGYFKEVGKIRDELGIDLAFNPELRAASEIAQILRFPFASKVERFAGGNVVLCEFAIKEDNPIRGLSLREITSKYLCKVLCVLVERKGKIFIPKGDFVLLEDDIISVVASDEELIKFLKNINMYKQAVKSVFIVGGGKISYYLSRELVKNKVSVKIIEVDRTRCEELAGLLPKATIICGDGTEEELLMEENIKGSDAFVALTGVDEENAIISLYAKQLGVSKVVSKVDRDAVYSMSKGLGLDSVVSPRLAIADQITKFVRAQQEDVGGGINTFYTLGGKAEAIEFTATEKFKKIGVPIKEMNIKKNTLIGGLVRGGEYILPTGNEGIFVGDRVIVITTLGQIKRLSDILN